MDAVLLLVRSDRPERDALARGLRAGGYSVLEADSVPAACEALRAGPCDAALLDDRLADGTALEGIAAVARESPGVPAILLVRGPSVKRVVEGMRAGAADVIDLSVDATTLCGRVARAIEARATRRSAAGGAPRRGADAFLGGSRAATALREQIRRVARAPARAVWLEGESGSGKGLVARALHEESHRAEGPFVAIACSAVPEALLESELFGHEAGAFTDAREAKCGLLEAACGGTLFLDEVGDLPPSVQGKLLGVLEDRRLRRLGGVREIPLDVRIVSATHGDPGRRTGEGELREDLYYRLRVVPLLIPPLRERIDDVPALARHFVARISEASGRPAPEVAPDALAALCARAWPGNVRELRNAVERALTLARGPWLTARDFREEGRSGRFAPRVPLPGGGVVVKDLLDDFVRQAMRNAAGNQCAAARLLGLSRAQIRRRLQRMGALARRGGASRTG